MRCEIMGMLRNIVVLVSIAIGTTTAVGQEPATPAQLGSLQARKSQLEAQQRADRKDLAELPGERQRIQNEIGQAVAQENLFATIQSNLVALAAQAKLEGKSPGEKLIEVGIRQADLKNKLLVLQAYQQVLGEREGELRQAIAARDVEIAQLERTIAYLGNPLKGDLDSEKAHLQNLGQKATTGDSGQLKWDIENTQRRIKELEQLQQQFQQQGGSNTGPAGGAQGAPAQGGYAAPSAAPRPSSQAQPAAGPIGYGPGYTESPDGSSMRPDHRTLQQQLPAKQPRTGHPAAQEPVAPASGVQPQAPPASGGACGPMTSCKCASGEMGHVPCDKSKGSCHCGQD